MRISADIYKMRYIFVILSLLLLFSQAVFATEPATALDSNTAFYEGIKYSYIISPPDNFVMNTVDAVDDGYSFAFIPDGENFDKASIIIGVNIFKIKAELKDGFNLDMLIENDTSAYRLHYGYKINIEEVKPIQNSSQFNLRTIYFNDTTGYIPNVMISYFDGEAEIIIFDLSISPLVPRFTAEKLFTAFLGNFKILLKGKLGFIDN